MEFQWSLSAGGAAGYELGGQTAGDLLSLQGIQLYHLVGSRYLFLRTEVPQTELSSIV